MMMLIIMVVGVHVDNDNGNNHVHVQCLSCLSYIPDVWLIHSIINAGYSEDTINLLITSLESLLINDPLLDITDLPLLLFLSLLVKLSSKKNK